MINIIVFKLILGVTGIVLIILSIMSLFQKRNIGPKSNPHHYYLSRLDPQYYVIIPIVIGIVLIMTAVT